MGEVDPVPGSGGRLQSEHVKYTHRGSILRGPVGTNPLMAFPVLSLSVRLIL